MVPWQTGEEEMAVAFLAAAVPAVLVGLVFLAVVMQEGFLVVTREASPGEVQVLEAPAEGAVATRN